MYDRSPLIVIPGVILGLFLLFDRLLSIAVSGKTTFWGEVLGFFNVSFYFLFNTLFQMLLKSCIFWGEVKGKCVEGV